MSGRLPETFARTFAGTFGHAPDAVVRSPGRVNLLGEHTDYNEGYVLPAALPVGTDVAVRRRTDRVLRTVALRVGASDERSLDDLRPGAGPAWTSYVRGCAAALAEHGYELSGADLLIDGDVPLGGGLSSSASLEVGVLLALAAVAGRDVDRMTLAQLGRWVEHEVVGVRSGLLDQLAVACSTPGNALLIDCRALTVEPVPLPPGVLVVVMDSGVRRELVGSEYNTRRAECESAAHRLGAVIPDVRALRDVTPTLLDAHGALLTDVERRRARHVVTENERVLAGVRALRKHDAPHFGALMNASHVSLRDDFEVSVPEVDALVAIAERTPGVLGCRLTGAGFGGAVVALARASQAEGAVFSIQQRYRAATGRAVNGMVCAPSAGAHLVREPVEVAAIAPAGGASR